MLGRRTSSNVYMCSLPFELFVNPVLETRRWQVDPERKLLGMAKPVLAINVELWVDLTTQSDHYFGRIVGPAAELAVRALAGVSIAGRPPAPPPSADRGRVRTFLSLSTCA